MIKSISLSSIPNCERGSRRGYRLKDIEEFLESGRDACEVVLVKDETPKNVWAAYHTACQRNKPYDAMVQVMMRRGRIFLIRRKGGQ